MSELDDLLHQENIFSTWGITGIPFSENANSFSLEHLREISTGRIEEIDDVRIAFSGPTGNRMLVYGWWGIGKTAFLKQCLYALSFQQQDKVLTAYTSLPSASELEVVALVALAREMVGDEWAQRFLNQMGIPPKRQSSDKPKLTVKAPFLDVETQKPDQAISLPRYPTLSFTALLERALQKYKHVIIAIDDMDKQDPARLQQLLGDAQGLLKSGASFMLTGHPQGLTRSWLNAQRGLFDSTLELKPIPQSAMLKMLARYLNIVRPDGKQLDINDPDALRPFTIETARELCRLSSGVPRWFNRLGRYVLQKAAKLKSPIITSEVFEVGRAFADEQLRGQAGLTQEENFLLQMIIDKGSISDADVNLSELEVLKAKTFSEIMPSLEKLMQQDLIHRLPSDFSVAFQPTPLILK